MHPLILFEDYTRREVHDIFDPAAPFATGSGFWGMQGIIPLPDRTSDYVFFVSYGRTQGEHTFDEGISPDGILRWQSQPSQSLDDPQIQHFINHDEERGSIYLFLRTKSRAGDQQLPYTYLGRLKYRGHDKERQRPVHFLWQLIDWPAPPQVLSRMRLELDSKTSPAAEIAQPLQLSINDLVETAPPIQRKTIGQSTATFRSSLRRVPSESENRALGLLGEKLVVEHERKRLAALGRLDLSEQVRHVSVEEGDGAGYDIKSFFDDGRPKYIEVKTTEGPASADFFISANEVAFSQRNANHFELRRVYDYNKSTNSGHCFSVVGDLSSIFDLTATHYRVSRLSIG